MSFKKLFLFIGALFLVFTGNAQILAFPTHESLAAKKALLVDSTRDSNSSKFRTYVVIVDTIYSRPISGDSLHTLRITQLKPSRINYFPGYRRRGVFNPILHYSWHSHWKKQLEGTLHFSEGTFSENWKSGGVNSISLGFNFDARADYSKDKISFTNEYQSQLSGFDSRGEGVRKSVDKLFLDTKFGYKLKKSVFLFSSANFQSQYINGYNYFDIGNVKNQKTKISGFLAPGYLTESLGLEYKPDLHFSNRIGLISIRQVFVIDTGIYHGTPTNYGVAIGKRGLTEVGFQLISDFHKEIIKNIEIKTHFEFFQSYKRPSNTNLRTDLYLTGKVNRFLNMNLSGTFLYDNNQDPRPQLNQFLSLGLTYRYSDFK